MRKMLKASVLMLVALVAWSCSSTKIVNSYTDPTAKTVIPNAKKIMVSALFKSQAAVSNAESTICNAIGSKAVPGSSMMANLTKDEAEDYLKANDFDLAVVSRMVSVEESTDYVPGNYNSYPVYYRGFRGYWGVAYSNYYDPGYYETTKSYKVETNVYDLKTDKLVYSAITSTYEPSSFSSGMNDVVEAIKEDMQKKGIIKANQ